MMVFLFFFPLHRMRDRGPCICGVGVWSLLLSLCLASLTHAHRSHTGRWIRVCVCAWKRERVVSCGRRVQPISFQKLWSWSRAGRCCRRTTWGNAEAECVENCMKTTCQEHTHVCTYTRMHFKKINKRERSTSHSGCEVSLAHRAFQHVSMRLWADRPTP